MTTATATAPPCVAHLVSHSTARLQHSRAALLLHLNAAFRTKKTTKNNLSSRNTSSTIAAALPFELSPPPIDHDFLDSVTAEGAKVSEEGIIETFENDDEAWMHSIMAWWIRASGDDRIQFLHNQTTANFECLSEGQGCETVFVTPTARTIDIAYAWIMKKAVLLMVSPETCGNITEMLNKYIFFADKVEIQDITKQTCLFALSGPKSSEVMANLNLGDLVGQPYGTNRHYNVNGMPITVGVGNIISEEADSVWKTLLSQGAIPLGSNAWEKLRITQGRPAPGKELTNDFNVLEAGLWNSISLNKGCYKGQETISRLITYDGVKQRLWGIHLSAPAEPGSPHYRKFLPSVPVLLVGKLTSYTTGRKECDHFALGYIKRKAASDGDTVIVGEKIIGTVVNVPFLSRQSPPPVKNSGPRLN
ncbi:hypothetical protein V6Z11_1Z029700 [Gossypium hirsutum]